MDSVARKPSTGECGHSAGSQRRDVGTRSDSLTFDSGSFRDRTSRVFVVGDRVYRTLNRDAHSIWRRVAEAPFFHDMVSAGRIVETSEVPSAEFNRFEFTSDVAGVLKHARVPFVSYPYEWSFLMLRDAALLHLQILKNAFPLGLILKDASPYNVQFRGSRPVFIDIGSFVELAPGEPWIAYRQFCELMLFPLLLQAYRGIHFQSILRSQLEGVTARQFLQWIRWRDMIRPGVFTNGWLQATLEKRTQGISSSTVNDLQSSGFHSAMIERMFDKLTNLIERLEWKPEQTQWTQYDDSFSHVAEDGRFKSELVRDVCLQKRRNLIWDLGCNDGRYSKLACEFADNVISMDQDHACVERLYGSLAPASTNILPLCVELANSSPAQGWRGRERKRLEERGKPDLILCLGLIHHLVIGNNIPLPDVIDWLADFGAELILEFPSKQDAMVRALLRNKRDQYDDYAPERLQIELQRHFEIRREASLPSGERSLFHAIPRRRNNDPK